MYSVLLLPSTGQQINVTGTPQRGSGYNNTIGNSHTVAVSLNNFVGRIYIEGSLASQPADSDWFAIELTPNQDYIQFPLIPNVPSSGAQGDNGNYAYNFLGNFIWLRARVDRSYLQPVPVVPALIGSVNQILLNFGAVSGGSANTTSIVGIEGPPGPQGLPGLPADLGNILIQDQTIIGLVPGKNIILSPNPVLGDGMRGYRSYNSMAVGGSVVPASDGETRLGEPGLAWHSLTVSPDGINIGSAAITTDGSTGNLSIGTGDQQSGIAFDTTSSKIYNAANVDIVSGSESWTFTRDGTVVFPDGTIQHTAFTGIGGANITTISSNAPLSPGEGELWYDTISGRMYIWFDHAWIEASPALASSILESPTDPVGVADGTMWYDTVTGKIYVRYQSQWVDTNGGSVVDRLVASSVQMALNSDGTLTVPADGHIRYETSNINLAKTKIGDTYSAQFFNQLSIAHDEGKLITIANGVGVVRLPQMTPTMVGAEFEFYFAVDAGQVRIQSYYTGVRATTDVFRGSIYVGVDNATTGKIHNATATTSTACDLFLGQHHAKAGSHVKVKAIAFDVVGTWMFQGMCIGDTGNTPNGSNHPFQDYN